jgi:hypothetical protein
MTFFPVYVFLGAVFPSGKEYDSILEMKYNSKNNDMPGSTEDK